MNCKICEEKITKNDEIYETFNGEPCHAECKESNLDYASTLVHFSPSGEINTTKFDEDFIFSSDEDNYDELPFPIKSQKWVSSGGYRGYTEWTFSKGYMEIADGWVTGYPDETTSRKLELGEIFEKLNSREFIAPCDIYWIFGVTSNIFSTSSSVVIAKEDKKVFEKWIKKINGGIEDFKYMFS